jgi:signal recognition particle receptor subunit beta
LEKPLKILITGYFNSGKSTLIQTMDETALNIEKNLSNAQNNEKTSTTTGFDFGKVLWARNNEKTDGVVMSEVEYQNKKDEFVGWQILPIELKGTPGKSHFSIVRQIISIGSVGVIFLIDGCDKNNIDNALIVLEETKEVLGEKIPMVIIANKSDRKDFLGVEKVSELIGEKVFEGSGKTKKGINEAIIHISKLVLKNKV